MASETQTKPGSSWALTAAIFSNALLSAYTFGGLVPVLPHIQEAFRDVPGSGPLVRFLISGLGISMIIGAPLAGFAAQRFGRRRILILSLLAFALFGVAGGLVNNLWAMIVSRLLFGLAAAACGTLLISLMAEFDDAKRNRYLGLNTMVGTISSFVMIPMAGFLAAISWRIPFFVHGVALIALIFVIIGVRDAAPVSKAAMGAEAAPQARARWPIFLLVVSLLAGVLTSALQLFMPFHLSDIGVKDPSKAGLVLMTSAIAVGLIAAWYATVRKWLSMRASFVFSFVVAGASLMIAGWAGTVPGVITGLLLMGIGVGVLAPHFYALAAVTGPPDQAARNVGLARGAYYAGPLAAQIAFEPVVASAGAGAATMAVAALAIVAGLVIATLHVPYHGAERRVAPI